MGTTTNYALPYPAASDAADGPTQIQALATAIDTKLKLFAPLYVEKSADESLASNTTLQNDDHLVIAGIPVGSWELHGEFFAAGTSASDQDIKLAFTFPTGALSWSGAGLHVDWTNAANARDVNVEGTVNATTSPTSARSFGLATSANQPIQIKGHLVNSAIGSLQVQWAQVTSNATATVMKQGSWMSLRRLIIP
jgi:hypothetical protein